MNVAASFEGFSILFTMHVFKVYYFFFLSRVILGDGYKIHIIVLDSQPYVSSGEISQLIWNNKEPDYLITRVRVDLFSIFTEIAKLYLYIFIYLR